MLKTEETEARRVSVRGVVQGVGFRPFVYQIALANHLTGWVTNTSGDVSIVVQGKTCDIERFLAVLAQNPPPQAHIESITTAREPTQKLSGFQIEQSIVREDDYQLISPDLATCPACRSEIFDTSDRRFRYPFTNCTNCGPRFTIIESIPYDRPRTTMRAFEMCPDCRREYEDPLNRRFHAQPNACPRCGPALSLTNSQGAIIATNNIIRKAARCLKTGKILAIKGLGGFLLACDATNNEAVQRLRLRKNRPSKPFAVMVKDLAEAKKYCEILPQEETILNSAVSPIVLLKRTARSSMSPEVAPGTSYLGVMLPYTPFHHLLMAEVNSPLIMTSGNFSEEPIAKDNPEALKTLQNIADLFILHNRDIYSRYDDSVVSVIENRTQIVRRARGYAPFPISLPFKLKPVLACGSELKNTFCLTRDNYAFVSQHIGDLENLETLDHFESTLRLYEKIFVIKPQTFAVDLHPDYLSTRWGETEARLRNLPLVRIQHHHAHIASCMADNAVRGPVIGVALDGTGYGTDGKIWGSEFMLADYHHFERKGYFAYLPLPGGSLAIEKPYRTAIGYIYALLGREALDTTLPCFLNVSPQEIDLIQKQIDAEINSPMTSSCGRLFDAVSALLGICLQIGYEGQAAVELETAAGRESMLEIYPYRIRDKDGLTMVHFEEMFAGIIADIRCNRSRTEIAAKFHNTIAEIIVRLSDQLSKDTGINQIALSGGVFQNRRLLAQVCQGLKKAGLAPLLHQQVPCNDGGISLGQALVASELGG